MPHAVVPEDVGIRGLSKAVCRKRTQRPLSSTPARDRWKGFRGVFFTTQPGSPPPHDPGGCLGGGLAGMSRGGEGGRRGLMEKPKPTPKGPLASSRPEASSGLSLGPKERGLGA